MCVGSLAGVTYLRNTVLTSSNKSETAVHCCDPALSVLIMSVSRNVFHVVSALQFIFYFLADQVSCRSYVGSPYRMRSLVQSLNSPFFPPHIGAEPGRARRESRILACACSERRHFFPQMGKNHIWKDFPDSACSAIF